MSAASLSTLLAHLALRLRLALAALGPVAGAGLFVCLAGVLALAWLVPEHVLQGRRNAIALSQAMMPQARPAPTLAPAAAGPNENLALFYDTLGEARYAEQQVRTLFALAARTGLVLSQGEYKSAYDSAGRFHTYQVNLPVKGSYGAVWRFALLALRAIPFASLDEISFRREAIGEPSVEARVRLTLYLADQAPGALR